MENKKKYDPDELLIMNALNSVYTQEFDILEGVEAKMKKRGFMKRGFVAAFIAASLIGTTAVAAQIMGSFDRLEGIIGQNEAAILTPVQITTCDAEQTVIYDGIRAEVVAVGVFGNIVDVYFTLEDMVANRLDGEFIIHPGLRPLDYENFPMGATMGSSGQPEIIHRDENGKVTLHARYTFGASVTGQQLVFSTFDIRYDLIDEVRPVDISLEDFASEAPSVLFQVESDDPWGTSMWGTGIFVENEEGFLDLRANYQEKIRDEGILILAPGELDMSFGVEGIKAYISSIGVVDGRLHVQLRHPDYLTIRNEQNWEGSASVHLIRGGLDAPIASRSFDWEADIVSRPYLAARFNTAQDGSFSWWEGGASYEEFIFDIDLADIHEYTLVVSHFSNGNMNLSWDVVLDLNDHYRELEREIEINISVGSNVLTQVNVNPFGLLLMGEGNLEGLRNFYSQGGWTTTLSIYVHTTEGTIIANPPEFGSSFAPLNDFRWFNELEDDFPISGRFSFGQMIDLDSILSIEVNGEHIEFE